MRWIKRGFEDFQKGTFGNGGQNLYVSRRGVLQRIYQYDVNGDGYPDILFANSQSMGERPPVRVYGDPLRGADFFFLPSGGSFDAVLTDLNGDGYDDLVLAAQHNGTHTDITSYVYYGSPEGLSERYRVELPVPGAVGVAAGDFDGRGLPSLVFACERGLRVFDNRRDQGGILPYRYTDLAIDAFSLAAGDLDGDGYDDLFIKRRDGSSLVLWGGPDGLSFGARTVISGTDQAQSGGAATTPGLLSPHVGWKPCLLRMDGRLLAFAVDGDKVSLLSFGRDRGARTVLSLDCPNAIAAASGDLDGDGRDDLAIVCCGDRNRDESSFVYWNRGGFGKDHVTAVPTRSAARAEIADLAGDGRRQLLLCQGGNENECAGVSKILAFDAAGAWRAVTQLPGDDAVLLLSGRTAEKQGRQVVAVSHKTGKPNGSEDVSIFLGGPDGYRADRRIDLPGKSAVSGLLFDSNDNGYVDALVSNCAEDAPHHDPGSFLYLGGADGLRADRRTVLPTVRDHGAIVGDFRKCGYLDIASGGFHNRSVRIFRGGPDGYDLAHPDVLVLGPNPEGYRPPVFTAPGHNVIPEQEKELYRQYGQTRWLFAADFNGDGWLDLLVSQILGPQCFILWGGPEGYSTDRMQVLYTDGVASANAADLDGDGYLDLVLAGHMATGKTEQGKYESYITIYWGGPNGYEEHRKTQLPAYCANSVCIGDFNGDGVLDIYATAYNGGRTRDLCSYVYYGKPGGKYSLADCQPVFNHSGSGCVAGDFNGDGYTDVAIACHKQYGNHVSPSFILWGGPDGLSEARKTVLPTKGPHGMMPVDAGNIMDRGDLEYYLSEPYAIQGRVSVRASWEADIPAGCSVRVQFRSAAKADALGQSAWSAWYDQGAGEYRPDACDAFLQYRLALGARCACGTPRVHSVTLDFDERQEGN